MAAVDDAMGGEVHVAVGIQSGFPDRVAGGGKPYRLEDLARGHEGRDRVRLFLREREPSEGGEVDAVSPRGGDLLAQAQPVRFLDAG